RRGERDVVEERHSLGLFGMLFQAPERVVGNGSRGIKAASSLHRGKLRVVLEVDLRAEEATLILQQIGAIKAVFGRLAVTVPFTGMVRAIPDQSEGFRH